MLRPYPRRRLRARLDAAASRSRSATREKARRRWPWSPGYQKTDRSSFVVASLRLMCLHTMRALIVTLLALALVGSHAAAAFAEPAAGNGQFAQRVLELTNAERQKNGLAPLVMNDSLTLAAQSYTEVLASGDCFAHTCGPEPDFSSRIQGTGYVGWSALAENIAAGYPTAGVGGCGLDGLARSPTEHPHARIHRARRRRGQRRWRDSERTGLRSSAPARAAPSLVRRRGRRASRSFGSPGSDPRSARRTAQPTRRAPRLAGAELARRA